MERFVNEQNLKRLRNLASSATSEAEKTKLLSFLAEEETKFRELHKESGGGARRAPDPFGGASMTESRAPPPDGEP